MRNKSATEYDREYFLLGRSFYFIFRDSSTGREEGESEIDVQCT